MSDTIFSNMLFYFYIGLLTTTKKASLICFINGVSCVTIMYSNREAFDVNNTTGLIVYLTSGILFISFGKMLDRIERFWQHRAYATESQLNRIRSDIAKEMHDLVSYSMSQTVLRARYSASNLFYPASARTEFSAIAATGADALHELRILLYALQKESGDSIPINATPLRKVQDISTSVELVTEDIEQAGFSVSYHIANICLINPGANINTFTRRKRNCRQHNSTRRPLKTRNLNRVPEREPNSIAFNQHHY